MNWNPGTCGRGISSGRRLQRVSRTAVIQQPLNSNNQIDDDTDDGKKEKTSTTTVTTNSDDDDDDDDEAKLVWYQKENNQTGVFSFRSLTSING